MKPTVFISSTVTDFRDLRSALKYWLEELGFSVNLSEHHDFVRNPSLDTFNACLETVRHSDVYVLLVGERAGSDFDESATITQREFREALKVQNKPVLCFVRQSVSDWYQEKKQFGVDGIKKEDGKQHGNDDARKLFAFIAEIEATKPNNGLGSIWINRFSDFRDITTVLRATLNIKKNLSEEALRRLVCAELENFLVGTTFKFEKSGAMSLTQLVAQLWVALAIDEAAFKANMMGSQIPISNHAMFLITTIFFAVNSPRAVSVSALREASISEAFMEYDPSLRSIKSSRLQREMQAALSGIERVTSEKFLEQLEERYVKIDIAGKSRVPGQSVVVEQREALFFLAYSLEMARAYLSAEKVYNHLCYGDDFDHAYPMVPISPFFKASSSPWDRVDERPTLQDLKSIREERLESAKALNVATKKPD